MLFAPIKDQYKNKDSEVGRTLHDAHEVLDMCLALDTPESLEGAERGATKLHTFALDVVNTCKANA